MNSDPVLFAKALADDTRQEIMQHLCCTWLSVNEVVDKLGGRVNQPTVSHHLKKLEEAHLVTIRQEGRQRFYTLNQEHITVCCGVLMHAFAPEYTAGTSADETIPHPPAARSMKWRSKHSAPSFFGKTYRYSSI